MKFARVFRSKAGLFAESDEPHTSVRVVTPNYFRTMRIPLLQGREFVERDEASTTQVSDCEPSLRAESFRAKTQLASTSEPGSPTRDQARRPCVKSSGVVGNVES